MPSGSGPRKARRLNLPGKKLKVTLVRSLIGLTPKQEATVRALGLRRIRQTALHADTPAIRGMIARVVHCVRVEEQDGDEA